MAPTDPRLGLRTATPKAVTACVAPRDHQKMKPLQLGDEIADFWQWLAHGRVADGAAGHAVDDDGVEFGLGDRDAARVGEAPRRVVPSVDPAADRRPRLPSL